jgi:hypothetical protein
MSLSILPLHHDYQVVSLTNIRSNVVVIEKTIIDVRVVEGIDAVIVEEEEIIGEARIRSR